MQSPLTTCQAGLQEPFKPQTVLWSLQCLECLRKALKLYKISMAGSRPIPTQAEALCCRSFEVAISVNQRFSVFFFFSFALHKNIHKQIVCLHPLRKTPPHKPFAIVIYSLPLTFKETSSILFIINER